MGKPRNALSSRDSHIWTLRLIIGGGILVISGLIFTIYSKQNSFNCWVPPDLSQGAKIKPGEILQPSAYTFAQYIWRELNTWPTSGRTDYREKIDALKCYVSEDFMRWLNTNYNQKLGSELDRTREVILRLNYDAAMSQPLGGNTFKVTLEMQVIERVNSAEVKNIVIRYPLRVTPDGRTCNPMGMRIEGFAGQPERIQ